MRTPRLLPLLAVGLLLGFAALLDDEIEDAVRTLEEALRSDAR